MTNFISLLSFVEYPFTSQNLLNCKNTSLELIKTITTLSGGITIKYIADQSVIPDDITLVPHPNQTRLECNPPPLKLSDATSKLCNTTTASAISDTRDLWENHLVLVRSP